MSGITDFPEDEVRPPATVGSGGTEEKSGSGISVRLPKWSIGARLGKFYHDVKVELQKTTWPTRSQVWSTTLVVVIAVIFFGFYLYGCDKVFGLFFNWLEKAVK